jgi:hypothetical protein
VFKNYLRNTILQESRTIFEYELQLGVIEGNLVTGFSARNVSLRSPIGDIISSEHIELKYDLFGFLFNRVGISNAVITKPKIQLIRSIDGSWNISHILKPTPKDTNPPSWAINIKRIELSEAEIDYVDSLLIHKRQIGERDFPPDSVIDYANIQLRPFSLEASLFINQGRLEAKIRNLQFNSILTPFTLVHSGGDFLLTENEISAKNVRIETSNSSIRLNVGMKEIDISKLSTLEELKTKPVNLSLIANNLDTKELKQFLYPWVDFLDREIKLQITANGKFGELNIDQLSVQLPHSMVQLQGQLRNLDHPRDLEMTIYGNDNFVLPADLLEYLPGLQIADLSFLGTVKFSLTYEGRPLDYKAHIITSTAAGDLDIDGSMKIGPKNITYSSMMTVSSLALGTLLNDNDVISNLNARLKVEGAGFHPLTMTALARVEMDSSTLNNLTFKQSVFVLDIADGLLRSHGSTLIGTGNYEFSNTIKFLQDKSFRYTLSGRVHSLDLVDLFQDKKYESDLSFDFASIGIVGATARSDTIDIRFNRSSYGTQSFETGDVHIQYTAFDNTHRFLDLRSTAADLEVNGSFNPISFIAAWDNAYRLITESTKYRFHTLDSLRSFGSSSKLFEPFHASLGLRLSPLDVEYRMQIKDLQPFGAVIHTPLSGHGIVEGEMVGDTTDMHLNGKVQLEQFSARTGTDTLYADTANFNLYFGGINRSEIFNTFNCSIGAELQNFEYNSILFNQLNSQLNVQSDSSYFKIRTLIDSTAYVDINGSAVVRNRLIELQLPILQIEIGKYLAKNTNPVHLTLGGDGFYARSLTMGHETEKAIVEGYLNPGGVSDLKISLEGFNLSNLKQILHRGPYAKSSTNFAGITSGRLLFRGSLDHPNIMLDMQANEVRTDDEVNNKHKFLGRINSKLSYFERFLNLDIQFVSKFNEPEAIPDLSLTGKLPYDFILTAVPPLPLEGEVDLSLQSTGMSMEFLEPFIPEISNLSGTMTCNMKMKGPIDAPRYEGTMSVRNAGLMLDPLGMRYILNGDFVPHGDHIQLKQFTIENDPQEPWQRGNLNLTGSLTLLGLKLKRFDIIAKGDLKVMREDRRIAGQKFYGNLYIATSPNGVQWLGDLTTSSVRGDIFIKDAVLTLPPERETEITRASVVNVVFTDDTSKTPSENIVSALANKVNSTKKNDGNEQARLLSSTQNEQKQSSFLDGINYNLGIETQGPTQLWFVFNTQTSERLYADLQGRFYFNRTPGDSRFTGQLEVTNRSNYNFIKKFDATGKILFTGDLLNPELNITGTYQGTHTILSDSANQTLGSSSSAESQKSEQVLVTLEISGTRNEPKTKISLKTKKSSEKDWMNWNAQQGRSDEEANAISFIVSGQFRDELTEQQRISMIGSNLGFALASSMVMGPISEAARKATYGVIQSVDMLYYGGQLGQATDLRLTGQVGEAVIRAGGRVFTGDFANTNVSVELPMSYIIGVDGLRNLVLTLERRVEGFQTVDEKRNSSNGARLFYRISF